MSLTQTVYNAVFKRTSTFALAIVVGAVFFERCFDQLGDGLYNYINEGCGAGDKIGGAVALSVIITDFIDLRHFIDKYKQFKDLRKDIALREAGEDD